MFAAEMQDGQAVALKVLKPRYGGDPIVEARFRREAETAANLRHPNIVRILDVGESGGLAYFCMELYPDSLAARLEREGPLEEGYLIQMGADVANGLQFAHQQGLVHRDINVHNVLLHASGGAVIGDFGIAHAITTARRESRARVTIGTPQYMSPEHARGELLDGRSDIYSLGVTLYKAATGTTPFTSTDWFELARMHLEESPRKPRSLRPELSVRIERIILRCLAKEPAERYPSAQALREELQHVGDRRRRTSGFGRVTVSATDSDSPSALDPWLKVLLPVLALLVIGLVAALVVLAGR